MKKQPRLTRTQVIARLRSHANAHGLVTSDSLTRHDRVLRQSITLHFPGLEAARIAAGVRGAPYVKPAAKTGPKPGTRPARRRVIKWTRQYVIDQLRDIDAAGGSTRLSDLLAAGHVSLIRSAQQRLGGLHRARRVAGIAEPKRVQVKKSTWTKQRVIDEIRSRVQKRQPLASTRVPFNLYSASRRAFGSWPKALAFVGVEHSTLRTTKKYTKEVIAERLRKAASAGSDLRAASLAKLVDLKAVTREFGTLRNALHAVGLDGYLIKRGRGGAKWSRTRVIETLRERAARGEHVPTPGLRRAMQLYFGGADEARRVARVPDPRDVRVAHRKKASREFAARHQVARRSARQRRTLQRR